MYKHESRVEVTGQESAYPQQNCIRFVSDTEMVAKQPCSCFLGCES